MGQQPVVAHADAGTPGNTIEQSRQGKRLPGKHEERDNSADVEAKHKESSNPIEGLLERAIAS
jgi:hypothetical protein